MNWIAYGIVRVAMGILGYGGNEWFRGPRKRRVTPATGLRSALNSGYAHAHVTFSSSAAAARAARIARRGADWRVIRTLLPYLWAYKARVIAALLALVGAKVANVGVPVLLKEIVDSLDQTTAMLVVPLALLVAYGALRLSTTVFTELREFLFAKVTQRAVRTIALEVFRHLHALSLRFHLARQTGGLTRDVERGTRGISTLISYTLFSILPTLVEIGLVVGDPDLRATTGRSSRSPPARSSLYILSHGADHRMAHELPPADERARLARPTRARSTACSTTRRSSTSATRSSRRAATTRACSAGSARR